ncbi:acyl-CoA dehydrogenase family protein [Paraburkholderia aspalathi]|uniref:acyl-CoA dehydrogenase family protein n=1 Tax=Paraburkholderia aspalathi TaxID=1324617 RepID=UPI001B0FB48F|nr:acyl-CoA dehydrogenase family protein [Paraburkholderia aspalathi]CAE6738347.1 Putative acyl-CoA dehydrogenase FadE17 [Paraburkholderia aspalathi]
MFIRSVRGNAGLDDFRKEVREFCKEQVPPVVWRKQQRSQHLERHEYDDWLKRLGAKGWLTGRWPKEHGGLAWTPEQFLAFEEELGRVGAPPLITFGFALAGPVIYTFGSPEQKAKYLSDIVRNNTWWCQGYSEPGAGSDLASLKTRAVRVNDHYIVNGQKIWTSYAHWADMMFALVRTNPDVKKQEGISFLLIDMKTPGITIRPIKGITLGHHLNEVFFENVRVPVGNLVGEENKGWTYAKFLLANERIHSVSISKFEAYLEKIRRVLLETKEGGRSLSEDPIFQRRMAELEVGLATVKALMADQLAAARTGSPPMMGAAALKLRGTQLQQSILQTGIDILGRYGLPYQVDALYADWQGDLIGPKESAALIYEHLYRRAASVYSGSNEVQKNIIAKGALGL